MYIEEKQLKDFINDSSLISKADFESAIAQSEKTKVSVGNILVDQGKISLDDLRKIQAYILGIAYVDLKGKRLDFEVLSLIPEPIARNHNIVAFKKNEDSLEVAMTDIDDLGSINFITKKVNLKILPRLTDDGSIKSALLQYQKSLKAEFGDIIQKESDKITQIPIQSNEENSEENLKKIAEELPVIKIVDTLLKHAIYQNASDIHVEQLENQVLVRYRIDGILRDAMVLPKSAGNGITARIKVLSKLRLDEKRLPQDGRFKIELNNEKVSFRVSILPVNYGEKTVLRLLRENSTGNSLESYGLHGEGLERIHEAMKQTSGMLLATGPTGSGKTTTLYTMLDVLNTPEVNISTIEDPIEYQIKRINQTQVRPEIGFTFANGLRSLVRQDPDIIMVGEIRDSETASLAINAALTGHLVLSTLHTNSASSAIPRLLDLKAEAFLLVSTINLIIGQRLVRRLCGVKEKYFLSKEELNSISKKASLETVLTAMKKEKIIKEEAKWENVPFYRVKKTDECPDGYEGRIGIHEILIMSQTIKNLVLAGKSAKDIEDQARKEGMLTMTEDGIFKAASGLTTLEEVLRVVNE